MRPVIVAGMHRSGTSAVARVLATLGMFLGADLQGDHESRTFIALNEALLQRYGATWDNPAAINRAWRTPAELGALAAAARRRLNGADGRAFLGRDTGWVDVTARAWGWKDPRNSFTLPLWRQVWPGAPVVQVTRNGIDVAASLRRRHREVLARYRRVNGHDAPAAGFRLGTVPFTHRAATLDGGFALWQEHEDNLARLRRAGRGPWLTVRYEDLVENPGQEIERLAKFCALAPPADAPETAARLLAGARPWRFTTDAELAGWAGRLLRAETAWYGYAEDIAAALSAAPAGRRPDGRSVGGHD